MTTPGVSRSWLVADRPGMSSFAGAVLVFGAGVAFSFGGLAYRLTDDVDPWRYIIFRGLGAVIATVVILALRYRGRLGELAGSVEGSHLLAGFLLGSMAILFIVSLAHASVAFVLFLQALAPVAAAVFSRVLLGERMSRAAILATVVSIVGVVIMVWGSIGDRVDPIGMIAVGLPLCFGLYATLIRCTSRMDPQVPMLFAALTLIGAGAIAWAATRTWDATVTDGLIGMLAGSILLAIPVVFMNIGARIVPAPEVALLLMGEVVLAPVWVWLFVDERPGSATMIGGAINLVAVFALLWWRRQASEAADSHPAPAWR